MRLFSASCLATLLFFAMPAHAGSSKSPAWLPEDKQIDDYNAAVDALNAGDLRLAETRARAVLRTQPDCGLALALLGGVELRLGRLEDARKTGDALVVLFPDQIEGHILLGNVYFGLQAFEDSLTHGQAALALAPDSVDAVYEVHRALLRLGRYDQDRLVLAAAEHLGPEVACLRVSLLADQDLIDEARTAMEACKAAVKPGFVATAASTIARHSNDLEGAVAAQTSLGIDTALAQAVTAPALFDAGRYAEAEALLTEEVVAESVGALRLRALARAAQDKDVLAMRDLDRAFPRSGDWIKVHQSGTMTGTLTFGDSQLERDNARRAAALYVRLLSDAGDLRRAAEILAQARERFGASVSLDAAEVSLVMVRDGPGVAWSKLDPLVTSAGADQDVLRVTRALHVQDPKGLTEAAKRALLASGDLADTYNVALILGKEGDAQGCHEVAAPGLVQTGSPVFAELQQLAYNCAVHAKLLDDANRILESAGDPGAFQASTRYNHALALRNAGRLAEADALLVELNDAGIAQDVANLRLDIALTRESWATVSAELISGGAPVQSQLYALGQLYEHEQLDTLRKVLPAVCPRARGEDRAVCEELQASLN